jgi:hypothetical protein
VSHAPDATTDIMPDLAPLGMRRLGDHLEFYLRTQSDILAQLPADYEQVVGQALAATLTETASLTAEINLENVPGISSRQLGSLIALSKVLRPRFGNVPLTHMSGPVRYLFQMTRTAQLFDMPG